MGLSLGFDINGRDKTAELMPFFKRLVLIDVDGLSADQLQLTLHNTALNLVLPTQGAVIKPFVNDSLLGTFSVANHSDDRRGFVHVHATSLMSTEFSTLKNRSFHEQTLGSILSTIASDNGLSAAISAQFSSQFIQHINQINESDSNLITRLGVAWGAVVKITGDHLVFTERNGQTASGRSLPLITHELKPSDKVSFFADGKFTLVTHGNPQYKAGSKVSIEEKDFLITKVRHDIQRASYRMDVWGIGWLSISQ